MGNLVFLRTHLLKLVKNEMTVKAVAPCTDHGWVWYCDVHDTHGNADSEDEAEWVAVAHENFFDFAGGEEFEGCDWVVARLDRPSNV
jgi:hypothetical protein